MACKHRLRRIIEAMKKNCWGRRRAARLLSREGAWHHRGYGVLEAKMQRYCPRRERLRCSQRRKPRGPALSKYSAAKVAARGIMTAPAQLSESRVNGGEQRGMVQPAGMMVVARSWRRGIEEAYRNKPRAACRMNVRISIGAIAGASRSLMSSV